MLSYLNLLSLRIRALFELSGIGVHLWEMAFRKLPVRTSPRSWLSQDWQEKKAAFKIAKFSHQIINRVSIVQLQSSYLRT